jgi:hypothetical protein
MLSYATEEIAMRYVHHLRIDYKHKKTVQIILTTHRRTGETIGGLLNASFG